MCWRFFPASHDESCLSGSWWFTDRCRLARWHTGILDKGHKKCEWSSTCLTLKQFDPNRDDPSGLGAFGITERGWCRGHTAVQISIMGMRLHLGYSRSSYPVNIFLRKFTSNIKIEVFETIYSVSFSLSIWCCYLPLSLSLSLSAPCSARPLAIWTPLGGLVWTQRMSSPRVSFAFVLLRLKMKPRPQSAHPDSRGSRPPV